jgi:DNA repair protein RadC
MNNTFKVPEFTIKLDSKVKASERITIASSKDSYKVFKEVFDADSIDWTETMIILALSNSNKVLGFYKLSSGGQTGVICDPKIVFQFALLSNASNIILSHNHPSGSLQPSKADKAITDKIKEAGKLLDIRLLDHLIITSEGYYSFADNCLI